MQAENLNAAPAQVKRMTIVRKGSTPEGPRRERGSVYASPAPDTPSGVRPKIERYISPPGR